jgi:hypothetical protein
MLNIPDSDKKEESFRRRMFNHLMSIAGVKNRLMIFINWAWKYLTYDQSLRLILRPKGCA